MAESDQTRMNCDTEADLADVACMPATRNSRHDTDIAPEVRRDEIITVIGAALARLIETDTTPPASRADTPTAAPAAKSPESAEIRLELSGKTRLSVPAG